MKNIALIARRELQSYLRTMSGYIIIAVVLFAVGLAFNGFAVPGTAKKSSEVLADFFTCSSVLTMVCAVFLSMRLIAEERQTGTVALLYSSPIHDYEIVLGKFVASFLFLCVFFLSTAYMPALVAVYGKVSIGHILTGYFGLMLVGATSLAIGTFGSALVRSQVLAAVLSGMMCLALTIAWLLGKVTDRPLTDIVVGLAWWGHFDPFRTGLIHLKHVAYFVLVTFLSLFAATRVLEARRWS
ncbi:MAG: ABC transporter permease subunit [Archangium sp.]|nr:ABC transporter permease subunit [Archangium sp.]